MVLAIFKSNSSSVYTGINRVMRVYQKYNLNLRILTTGIKNLTYPLYEMDWAIITWGKIFPAKHVMINMLQTWQKK